MAIKESVTLLHNSQLFVEMCVHVHMYMSGEWVNELKESKSELIGKQTSELVT